MAVLFLKRYERIADYYLTTKQHHFQKKGGTMIKVKTFASPLKIFQAKKEIEELDAIVNKFIEDNEVQKIISVSDAPTSDDNGATIGLIRVLAYE